jgi:hypothetical protein
MTTTTPLRRGSFADPSSCRSCGSRDEVVAVLLSIVPGIPHPAPLLPPPPPPHKPLATAGYYKHMTAAQLAILVDVIEAVSRAQQLRRSHSSSMALLLAELGDAVFRAGGRGGEHVWSLEEMYALAQDALQREEAQEQSEETALRRMLSLAAPIRPACRRVYASPSSASPTSSAATMFVEGGEEKACP